MNMRELQRALEPFSTMGTSKIETRGRALREAGLIDMAGRGRNAYQITTLDAVHLLLAIGGGHFSTIARDVRKLATLTDAEGDTLAGDMVNLIEIAHERDHVASVRIAQTIPYAEVRTTGGNRYGFGSRPSQCGIVAYWEIDIEIFRRIAEWIK